MQDLHRIAVVVVESDPLLLKALRKALQSVDSSMQITLISEQQLDEQLFKEKHFDVAFISVSIENEQFTHALLVFLQQQSPLTVRCLLKGVTSKEWNWQLDDNIHFCLAKPYSHADLRHVINCTAQVKALPIDTPAKMLLGKMKNLPVMRQQITAIMEAFAANPVEIPIIAELISNEPALSGRVIQTANSAFLGFSSETVNLKQALARIGTTACHALVIHTEAHNHYQHRLAEQLLVKITTDAFARANQAREFAIKLGLTAKQKDTVFILGLLSGIGAMALTVFAKGFSESHFLNQELVSAYILNLWGFTPAVTKNMLLPNSLSEVTSTEMAVHYLAKVYVCGKKIDLTPSELTRMTELGLSDLILEFVTQ